MVFRLNTLIDSSKMFPFLCIYRNEIFEPCWLGAECGGRCAGRCSKTAYKKPCMFFCQKCCAKCLCVPPGTYGNKQVCPCYNNWKTQRGGPKCPWKWKHKLLLATYLNLPCLYYAYYSVSCTFNSMYLNWFLFNHNWKCLIAQYKLLGLLLNN